jgi:hypothetical protein
VKRRAAIEPFIDKYLFAAKPQGAFVAYRSSRLAGKNAFLRRKGIIGKAVLPEMNRDSSSSTAVSPSPSPSVNLVAKLNAIRCASTSIPHVKVSRQGGVEWFCVGVFSGEQ